MQDLFLLELSQGLNPETEPARKAGNDLSFPDFIRKVNPRFTHYWHVRLLCEVLQKIADGELKRVMVFEPPRHGKSELVSRLFPAYVLHRHPHWWAAIASYSAELSYGFSRNARDNYRYAGHELKADAASVKQWETGHGGGLWACGVGGAATGRGFHVGIIDDPLKNAEEAASRVIREKQWDWFESTWKTRQEPDAAMLVTLTRWNEDDLAGRIIEDAKQKGEAWTVVILDAIKSFDNLPVPAEWIYRPDDPDLIDKRKAGEALCPERYDLDALAQFQANKYFFSALYQQRPSPAEGSLWQRSYFDQNTFHEAPALGAVGFDWDTAYTQNETNSATAYVKSGVAADGTIYVLDAGFRWVETPAAEQWMIELGGPHFIEAKASGKGLAQRLRLQGRTVVEVKVEGDKVLRVQDVLPEVQAGRVKVAPHILPMILDDEKQGILKFPNGSHDDLNDALVQAIKRHRQPKRGVSLATSDF